MKKWLLTIACLLFITNFVNALSIDKNASKVEFNATKFGFVSVHGEFKDFSGEIVMNNNDITKLNCDAIVNPGNEKGLGCFEPSHDCLDNKINVDAGMRLRLACNEIMSKKNYHLEKAECIITKAFNLPSKYIIKTNGPIIDKKLEEKDKDVLKNCYINALNLAKQSNIKTIAFPCIATGQFNFPNREAAEIAYNAINEYVKNNPNVFDQIIICTYKDVDYNYYKLLINSK